MSVTEGPKIRVSEKVESDRTLKQIQDLHPGDTIIYHTGFLAIDAGGEAHPEIRAIAAGRRSGAQRAHDSGLCYLTQKRLMNWWYQYIATRKRK